MSKGACEDLHEEHSGIHAEIHSHQRAIFSQRSQSGSSSAVGESRICRHGARSEIWRWKVDYERTLSVNGDARYTFPIPELLKRGLVHSLSRRACSRPNACITQFPSLSYTGREAAGKEETRT